VGGGEGIRFSKGNGNLKEGEREAKESLRRPDFAPARSFSEFPILSPLPRLAGGGEMGATGLRVSFTGSFLVPSSPAVVSGLSISRFQMETGAYLKRALSFEAAGTCRFYWREVLSSACQAIRLTYHSPSRSSLLTEWRQRPLIPSRHPPSSPFVFLSGFFPSGRSRPGCLPLAVGNR